MQNLINLISVRQPFSVQIEGPYRQEVVIIAKLDKQIPIGDHRQHYQGHWVVLHDQVSNNTLQYLPFALSIAIFGKSRNSNF